MEPSVSSKSRAKLPCEVGQKAASATRPPLPKLPLPTPPPARIIDRGESGRGRRYDLVPASASEGVRGHARRYTPDGAARRGPSWRT
ncbi:hypothetical protein E2C01_073210 [Portunus trituberculatus]|uniref:Uncharacterized protein n=1 Tax=Portunus trituberculatus TaxID=210409 RepID=A0A5B7I4L0_PORTR|nr:hypothetical protein [Portunus trituberculatus]